MESHKDLIDLIGNDTLASRLDVSLNRIAVWKHRDNIPAGYLIDVASMKEVRKLKLNVKQLKGMGK